MMNAFYEHHQSSIRFQYACFDRILLNAAIPLLLEPTAAQGFFSHYRHIYPITRKVLHDISERYHQWVRTQAERWKVPILEYPEGRRNSHSHCTFTTVISDLSLSEGGVVCQPALHRKARTAC